MKEILQYGEMDAYMRERERERERYCATKKKHTQITNHFNLN
jgi:hypothetical protein